MKEQVVGFLFKEPKEDLMDLEVLLILKTHPDFQAGKYNGIGGSMEPIDIQYYDAMSRELKEETGIVVDFDKWAHVVQMNYPYVLLHVFTAILDPLSNNIPVQLTEEVPSWIKVRDIFENKIIVMANLKWLIPLCADRLELLDKTLFFPTTIFGSDKC